MKKLNLEIPKNTNEFEKKTNKEKPKITVTKKIENKKKRHHKQNLKKP